MNRTKIECEESCVYYKPSLTGKEIIEGLPVHKVLKSKTDGSYAIISQCRISKDRSLSGVTEMDVAAGTCGTPLETPLFFICDKCK